jgi:hypothetical protein
MNAWVKPISKPNAESPFNTGPTPPVKPCFDAIGCRNLQITIGGTVDVQFAMSEFKMPSTRCGGDKSHSPDCDSNAIRAGC